ncbi:hypothetical protein [Steroidobacter sp.]|uniref:hypothetical protein n=1 Tax=Steroidobacter sp. TaxID=1978227 RepID=UPI001A62578A|nr:hypothetical protein [Steroidobacter sp.]MBL8268057.1 hypothetical protein [Steroidobacter sp.]
MTNSRDSLRSFRPKVEKFEHGGQTFHVRGLSGAGRARYLELCRAGGDAGPSMAKVVALGLCEEDGSLTYSVDNDKDVTEIGDVDGTVLQAIVFKLYQVSGLATQAIENASKNS